MTKRSFARAVRTCATRLLPEVFAAYDRADAGDRRESIAVDTVDQATKLIQELDRRDLLWDEDD